ncbi:hypothetical protein GEV33_007710 [Tenebrio molitor]|uniref:HAT C-terminal dimerisation domain-containing protein n=1 Tax=Tenebrio molitor TaxID=7067 RepID=A0A8J6HJ71_TENMO|nr:hypothetical protein GEV33_007710 [Tenebrio molitor]
MHPYSQSHLRGSNPNQFNNSIFQTKLLVINDRLLRDLEVTLPLDADGHAIELSQNPPIITTKASHNCCPRSLQNMLAEAHNVHISSVTIRKRLRGFNLTPKTPAKGPQLTADHRRASDESRYCQHSSDKRMRVYRRPGERYAQCNIVPTVMFGGGSVMVWSGITLEARTELVVIPRGSITAVSYIANILEPHVMPFAPFRGNDFLFMHDNAKPHSARIVQQYLAEDCPTRWNSTFYMMERFAKLKDSLVLYLSANPIAMISPEDWINVQKFLQIMQPFEEITRNLSNSQVSISSVIPLIEVLMTTLQQEETKPDTSEQFQNFTRKLRDELNSSTRFGDLMKDDKYTIATYLDPRYKSKFFNNVVTEQVESKILNLIMIRTKDTNANQEDDCRPSTPSSPKRARIQIEPSTSCALQTLESLLNTNEDQLDPTTTDDNSDNLRLVLQSNILEYQKEKRLPLQQDPVKWWQSNGHKYHHIVPLVRQYLSAPPSSVASEQLFSGAGLARWSATNDEESRGFRGPSSPTLLGLRHGVRS